MTISRNVSDDEQLLERLSGAARAAKAGDIEAAILELKQLLESDPRHELGNGMLASIYAQIGLTDRALHYFRQTLAHHPENLLARVQLATLLLETGKKSEALDTLQPLLSMPQDHPYHAQLQLLLKASE